MFASFILEVCFTIARVVKIILMAIIERLMMIIVAIIKLKRMNLLVKSLFRKKTKSCYPLVVYFQKNFSKIVLSQVAIGIIVKDLLKKITSFKIVTAGQKSTKNKIQAIAKMT
jgi:hypothetical protein